jgi:hypothetical protein
MRQRAQRASTGERWESGKHYDSLYLVDMKPSLGPIGFFDPVNDFLLVEGCQPFENPRIFLVGHDQADHIASWPPAAALAVADWLELAAVLCEATVFPYDDEVFTRRALAVAQEHLGETWGGDGDAGRETS